MPKLSAILLKVSLSTKSSCKRKILRRRKLTNAELFAVHHAGTSRPPKISPPFVNTNGMTEAKKSTKGSGFAKYDKERFPTAYHLSMNPKQKK
mmetsp:Transcript_30133/g.39687  ORF Transcript_30133/g.39687 Transcript_30133/m.39687 type:complete len:93 (-) Transcript_30133:519-797(-)